MRAIPLAMIILFLSAPALAITIHVPGDEPTIQAGINAASVGDTVLVASDIYFEQNVQMKPGIVLRGETGMADGVIIDAQRLGTVMICEEIQADTRIEGLTFANGLAPTSPLNNNGGGIHCIDSSPMITQCAFIDNEADSGGGLYCRSSDPLLDHCRFINNRAYIGAGARLVLSNPTIVGCHFTGNDAESDGGALASGDSSPNISFSVFRKNTAEWWGGVLFASGDSSPYFHNCTMVYNATRISWGGAIFSCGGNRPVLKNDLIAFNSGDGAIVAFDQWSLPQLACCDVTDNEGGNYGGALPDQTGLNGNISADPLFCAPLAGDLTLAAASPCLPENNECQVLIGALGQGCGAPAAIGDRVRKSFASWCSPNPSRSAAAIGFHLADAAMVSLELFDLQGRRVRALAAAIPFEAGSHQLVWDGRGDGGVLAAPGIYFYQLIAGVHRSTGKVTLAE